MKNNKKTLKRKSLLKKRKGGKTQRRKSRRVKGGIPGIPSLGIANAVQSIVASPSKVGPSCNEYYDCCSRDSKCTSPNAQGGTHFLDTINSKSLNLNEEFLNYGSQKKSPSFFMKEVLKSNEPFQYCKECLRVICNPKQTPTAII
jgi:hypothetical protein